MNRPPSFFFISITHHLFVKTTEKCLWTSKCLWKVFGTCEATHTHTVSPILVNTEINFHTKSASITGSITGSMSGYEIITCILFSSIFQRGFVLIRCLSASLVLWSHQAQSAPVPNWAKSITLPFVVFSWWWASNNSRWEKDQYCKWNKALDVLQCRCTYFYKEAERQCLESAATGLAQTLDQLYKCVLCCFISTDYLTVSYLGLIVDPAERIVTTGDMCVWIPPPVHLSKLQHFDCRSKMEKQLSSRFFNCVFLGKILGFPVRIRFSRGNLCVFSLCNLLQRIHGIDNEWMEDKLKPLLTVKKEVANIQAQFHRAEEKDPVYFMMFLQGHSTHLTNR